MPGGRGPRAFGGRPIPSPGLVAAICLILSLLAACSDRTPSQPTEWREGDGHRWRELAVPPRGRPGFRVLGPERTGIRFANVVSESSLVSNQILENGSGVAIGDVNGDGLADLYLARLEGPNALYLNRGAWRFEETAEAAGVALPERRSTGAVLADVDGDGDLDLVVTALGGPDGLFLNDGSGRFQEVTEEAGLRSEFGATTAALADVDGDGDLDLYVTDYKRRSVLDLFPPEERTFSKTVIRNGDSVAVAPAFREHYELVWEGTRLERYAIGEPDRFYLNDGSGRFQSVPFSGGRFLDPAGHPLLEAPRDWGLAARFQDLDDDGDPDLYVCNDLQSPDRLWLNLGDGRFQAISPLALRTTSGSSMAVDFADVDLDGDLDVFTVDMLSRDPKRRRRQVPVLPAVPSLPGEIENTQQVPRNVLLLARGDGTYAEAAHYARVEASDWSWATLFLDVDLDGDEDLLIPTGNRLDHMDADTQRRIQEAYLEDWRAGRLMYGELRLPNVAFRNDGGRFTEVGREWGFGSAEDIGHGIATGDLDGDGDLDVVVNRFGAPALVLRNESSAPRVQVRLEGRPPNPFGVGAVVRLHGGPVPVQRKEVTAGGLYLSSSEPVVSFAAGEAETLTLTVRWRSGALSRLEDVRPNRLYVVREPEPTPEGGQEGLSVMAAAGGGAVSDGSPIFAEVPLDHLHVESVYDDFRRQPLLPLRLSQLGPGVAWLDADGDGDADLAIGSGRGGTPALYRNDSGRLRPAPLALPEAPLDQTTLLGLPRPDGGADLLVGQMSYEAPDPESARRAVSVYRIGLAGTSAPARTPRLAPASPVIAGEEASIGPLALADVDGDGDLDLFVGGRVRPAAYPAPVGSRLFRNEDGRFVLDATASAPLAELGMVSAATFSDLDGDGDPDLLAALDWGPIAAFRNEGGRFVDATEAWGLSGITNRWNGVTTGDWNGDGRLDIAATAWGWNTGLPATPERPLALFWGDFDANGTTDAVLSAWEPGLGDYVPLASFERLGAALPYVRERIGTFTRYAESTTATVLGEAFAQARRAEAAFLGHFLFLNRGDHFEPLPLPLEAQLAPAFYVGVADFDADGNEDLFLAQNFYATEPETPRYDAGRGLWLRGDGNGGFEPVPGQRSGVAVYGDARGAALGDFDGDARVDLVVTQNGAAAKLYRNRGGAAGVRVRLLGPPGNPAGIGAVLRVVYDDGPGPAREVKAGTGYWSQDDPVQVLGLRAGARAVRVRWPGGAESEHPLDGTTREVRIRAP